MSAYENERRPPTSEIIRLNRAGGPERIIDLVEARAPRGFDNVADVVSDEEVATILGNYARVSTR